MTQVQYRSTATPSWWRGALGGGVVPVRVLLPRSIALRLSSYGLNELHPIPEGVADLEALVPGNWDAV